MTNMGLNYDLTEQEAMVTPTYSLIWPGTDLVLHMHDQNFAPYWQPKQYQIPKL